jgi:oligosaccharide repeat unit polymerase
MSNMLLISLLSFICLATHLALERNPGHPGVIHGAIWLLISLGYTSVQTEMDVVSTRTIIVLIIGILVFSIGIFWGGEFKNLNLSKPGSNRRYFPIQFVIVLVSAIGLALLLGKAFEYLPINRGTSWLAWYTSLRSAVSQRNGSFGLAGYGLNFCFAGVAYLILYSRRERFTPWLMLCITLALGFAIFSTGRTYLVLLICMILGTAMPRRWRTRALLLLLVPLLIVMVTWLAGRFDSTSSSALRSSFELHAKMYSISAVGSFDYLVNSNFPQTWGSMTFRTPLAVLQSLGIPVEVPELVQPHPPTRIPANVYTVFSPYYRDFGLIGVGFFMLLLGTLHGWVFRQLKAGIPIIIVANALLFYALFMQFFQDQYFSLMSQWIQILGWTYVFNKLQPLPGTANRDRP